MSKKQELWKSLNEQKELMLKNSELMIDIYTDDSNARELFGAAKITQDWMDELAGEIKNEKN